MIRNIVFDVGGVLMEFDTHRVTADLTNTEEDALRLHREIFDHPDWIAADRALPEAYALQSMQSRLPEHLQEPAAKLMETWDQWLKPDGQINALAEELANMGYSLYILSNTSTHFYRFRERIPSWPLFKGTILSFEERLMKPDPEIFRRLYSRFGLAPSECFFIDDSHLNIEAAIWSGMSGCLYRGDVSEIRQALRKNGVPVSL